MSLGGNKPYSDHSSSQTSKPKPGIQKSREEMSQKNRKKCSEHPSNSRKETEEKKIIKEK